MITAFLCLLKVGLPVAFIINLLQLFDKFFRLFLCVGIKIRRIQYRSLAGLEISSLSTVAVSRIRAVSVSMGLAFE